MSFVKTGAFRGLSSDSDDIKIDSSGNVSIVNGNIVNKNLIINGGMNVWQRSTSTTGISGTSTDGYVTVDRWTTYNLGLGTWTQSQSTDVPSGQGFAYSLKMECTTADASPGTGDQLNISQKIEAQNCQHLLFGSSSPKSITLSFWVKSNKTGTYIINAVKADGGIRFIAKSYTIDTANTWEKKTITFEGDDTNAIDNDNGYGIDVQWWLGAGSNYTSGTLQTTWGGIFGASADRGAGQVNVADSTSNEWYMTGCQLEVGENASGFEFEPYETVLRKCQRYYYQIGGESAYERVGGAYVSSSTLAYADFPHPVVMRAIPSYSFSSVGNFAIAEPGIRTCTAISNSHSSSIVGSVGCTMSGATGGRGGALITNNNTSARFKVDAEL